MLNLTLTLRQQFSKLINGRSQRYKHQKSKLLLFNDIIEIKSSHLNLLKIDKKLHKDIDIYYIGYIITKKFGDSKNIHSVNPLYLIIRSATGHSKEKNGEKYVIIDSTEKYEEVVSAIISEIKKLNGGKELFYEKGYARTGVNTKDD